MKSLLIANRGEIACRIIKSAKRRGIRTIAVYSDADKDAWHVKVAHEAVCIGPAAASESYLDIDQIINAAQSRGAEAIHPGYGFLSENPALVEACELAGIVFVGPSAHAMCAMGLKDAAKRLMQEAGVPVVPGYHGASQEDVVLLEQATHIGFPVLIKARAGGGGKGMRKVDCVDDFSTALHAAQREAQASFGDAHVLIEKYIQQPRHIEVQVFGDKHGNVVHLFERDCSLQRRHQKVIEEAPAPGMTEPVRLAMTRAAIAAAKAIDYHGAGTVEFIVDGSEALRTDGFWFMEMNTRLQVEHPVTEAITGVDLVDWQLLVAQGHALPLSQSQITMTGHAVEARLYAENPAHGFMPSTGQLERLSFSARGRTDSGVVQGDHILPFYDPMLAKLIAHSDNRHDAFQNLAMQLSESVVLGTQTNREFLWRLVSHDSLLNEVFDTSFIDVHLEELTHNPHLFELASLACVALVDPVHAAGSQESVATTLGVWQLWGSAVRHQHLIVDGSTCLFTLERALNNDTAAEWLVRSTQMAGFPIDGIKVTRVANERWRVVHVHRQSECVGIIIAGEEFVHVHSDACAFSFQLPQVGVNAAAKAAADTVASPMPGRVVAIHCVVGQAVCAGEPLVSVEAMKMEQALCCERDGVVASIAVQVGDQVPAGHELVRLEESG